MYIPPEDNYPTSIIFEYLDWKDRYDREKLAADFGKTNFMVRGVLEDDVSDTLVRAG